MGRLVYGVIASLDGYVADAEGGFGWAEPDEEVLAWVTDQEEPVGTHLYGRTTYEMMTVWEHDPGSLGGSPGELRFAEVWQRARKVVWSTTMTEADVTTRDTTLRSRFDADEVRALKEDSAADLTVFGPTLAGHAFAAGLVDELQLTVVPHLVGGGLPWASTVRAPLVRRELHEFAGGALWLRYDVG